ncbi:class II aldolase/adducin family protein [bacterium]|nr:class II aldolase/adducin family protein [bacterium]
MSDILKQELLHAAKVLAASGCLPATDGNFSVRVNESQVLVTKRGIEKRNLQPSDLILVEIADPKPHGASSEWQLHRALYLSRPEVHAILHVHAPHLGSFAAVGKLPNKHLLIEAEATLGGLALIPFIEPGTAELGEAAVSHGKNAGVLLLERHGVVAVGVTIREALYRLERAELLAKIELGARLLLDS